MRLPFVLLSREAYDGQNANYKVALQNATNFQEYMHDHFTREMERERGRYERQAEYNRALVQQIVEMKKDGFTYRKPVDPNKPAPAPTATSIEDIARDGARKEFIDNMTSQLRRAGIGDAEARTEATRLAGEMYNTYGEGE